MKQVVNQHTGNLWFFYVTASCMFSYNICLLQNEKSSSFQELKKDFFCKLKQVKHILFEFNIALNSGKCHWQHYKVPRKASYDRYQSTCEEIQKYKWKRHLKRLTKLRTYMPKASSRATGKNHVVGSATTTKKVKNNSAFRAAFSSHSCMHMQSKAAHADYPNCSVWPLSCLVGRTNTFNQISALFNQPTSCAFNYLFLYFCALLIM